MIRFEPCFFFASHYNKSDAFRWKQNWSSIITTFDDLEAVIGRREKNQTTKRCIIILDRSEGRKKESSFLTHRIQSEWKKNGARWRKKLYDAVVSETREKVVSNWYWKVELETKFILRVNSLHLKIRRDIWYCFCGLTKKKRFFD
jgi:hypothetical protein